MKIVIICIVFCISTVLSAPFVVVNNQDVDEIVAFPLHRVRRQAWNLFQNDRNRIDAAASISKQLGPGGPPTFGGQLGYSHIPSGNGLSVGVARTPGFGTDLNARGVYNIFRNRNSALDATAEYSRHFGGPFGTGKPNYGVGLKYELDI